MELVVGADAVASSVEVHEHGELATFFSAGRRRSWHVGCGRVSSVAGSAGTEISREMKRHESGLKQVVRR